jgi:hypothetical protein
MRLHRTWGIVLSFALSSGVALAQPAQPSAAPAAAPASAPAPGAAAPASTAAPAPAPGTTAAPAPAPAPSSGAPPPADTPVPPGTEAGAYTVRLRSLERNVNDLKEQVFRVKARLNLLKETVLGGVIGASRCVIRHKNEMGNQFRLIKAVYALDGVQILSKADDSGRLAEMTEFDIYNGAIQPGSHTLSVHLVYQGYGYGVFSYLKNYKFNVRSSNTFVAGDGKATMVTVVGYEKGGVTTEMQDKPDIKFAINSMNPEAVGTAPAPKK